MYDAVFLLVNNSKYLLTNENRFTYSLFWMCDIRHLPCQLNCEDGGNRACPLCPDFFNMHEWSKRNEEFLSTFFLHDSGLWPQTSCLTTAFCKTLYIVCECLVLSLWLR